MEKCNKYCLVIVKISLLALFIWLLVRQINTNILFLSFKKFNTISLVGATLCILLRPVILAIRINHAAAVSNIKAPLKTVLRWEYELIFLELIFPIPNAEDILRTMYWKNLSVSISKSLSLLLFSRICGLIVITLILPFSFIMLQKYSSIYNRYLWISPTAIFILVIAHKKVLEILIMILRKIKFISSHILDTLATVVKAKYSFVDYLLGSLLASLQLFTLAGAFYILALNSGVQLTYWLFFLSSPLLILSFMLPISIQGIGVPETTMVWLMISFGVNPTTASAIGLIHFSCYGLLILVAAVLFITDSNNKLIVIKKVFGDIKKLN